MTDRQVARPGQDRGDRRRPEEGDHAVTHRQTLHERYRCRESPGRRRQFWLSPILARTRIAGRRISAAATTIDPPNSNADTESAKRASETRGGPS